MTPSLLQTFSKDLSELVTRTRPGVIGVEPGQGRGSGTVLSRDGFVLTNAHVVGRASKVRVRRRDGSASRADLVGVDHQTDLAVLRVEGDPLEPLPFASAEDVEVGQLLVAIGNPLDLEGSVSLGIVSALDRSLNAPKQPLEGLVQTDAAINPGNSGGPLVNASGQVVAIATAVIPMARGIGFGIPAMTADWVAACLIRDGRVERRYLGIAARSEVVAVDGTRDRGVHVLSVRQSSPAAVGGLRAHDWIVSADGSPTPSVGELQRHLALGRSGPVSLDVRRGSSRRAVTVEPTRAAA